MLSEQNIHEIILTFFLLSSAVCRHCTVSRTYLTDSPSLACLYSRIYFVYARISLDQNTSLTLPKQGINKPVRQGINAFRFNLKTLPPGSHMNSFVSIKSISNQIQSKSKYV